MTLASARKRRDEARTLLAEGIDPSQAKQEARRAKILAVRETFELVARDWLRKMAATRSVSTQDKIKGWLENNIFPVLGRRPISEIKPRDVLLAVQKMEARGSVESAHRVKQVCGQIFRYAVATGQVERDVTIDLRGAIAPPKKGNYAAITDPEDVGPLLRAIYGYNGYPAAVAALKLAPLLFVRPGELRAAEWTEFDLEAAEWRIPAAKMKMKIDHLVPLATQAVAILRDLQLITGDGRYVFPSLRSKACMSENTVNAALRYMGYEKEVMTGHGFRAMARTILDEVLGERPELIEHQLAHAVRDPLGRAYNRTSHLPARRAMMQRWADYLDQLRLGTEVTASPTDPK